MMKKEGAKIKCTIFQKQEPTIRDITDKINKAKVISEKAEFAEELQREAGVLLSCPDYDKGKLDCNSCHFIANLRKEMADLIIKAKRLA